MKPKKPLADLKSAWRNYRRCCKEAVAAVECNDLVRACKLTQLADKWYLENDKLLNVEAQMHVSRPKLRVTFK